MNRIPHKVSETGLLPGIRMLARTLNQLIEKVASMELADSPTTRIERTANRTVVHAKGGATQTGTDDTWY